MINRLKQKKSFFFMLILGIITVISGISYAILTIILSGTGTQSIVSGELVLELHESQSIELADVVPVRDETGLTSTPYTFSVENTGTIVTKYHIYLEEQPLKTGETRLNPEKIRYEIRSNNSTLAIGNLTGTDTLLYTTEIMPKVTHDLELRLWIDFDVTELKNTDVFESKIRIEGTQEVDYKVNEPDIVGDMIPVVYDETKSSWVKADTSAKWYDYDNQKWANVVTVTEETRQNYLDSSTGTSISMDDINTMFVWIPRYSYTIKDTYGYQIDGASEVSSTTPGAIDIMWQTTLEISTGTAKYTGDVPDNWYTPSAFCWGNTCDDSTTRTSLENRELIGIWVAKFESGQSTLSNPHNTVQQPIIKPSIDIWNNLNISNAYYSIQQYMNNTNGEKIFGLNSNTYDAHMMKNTEWGAVVYLSQSIYGKYGNSNYHNENKEISKNNCSNYITGIGGETVYSSETVDTCTTNTYETEKGQAASTTGNIYGIYDMSGGTDEYVMGVMEDTEGNPTVAFSGFTQESFPEAKYYNSYANGTSEYDLARNILGDATSETRKFYSDYSFFPIRVVPWFSRGGSIKYSGVFGYDNLEGSAYSTAGFRITITP